MCLNGFTAISDTLVIPVFVLLIFQFCVEVFVYTWPIYSPPKTNYFRGRKYGAESLQRTKRDLLMLLSNEILTAA